MNRAAARAFFLAAPLAACLWLHWYGLKAWFWADDFAWLGLHNVVARTSLLSGLFEPFAQGTVRPWSERATFLLSYRWFGVDALPFHVLAFSTHFANLLLLIRIVRKMGGSRLSALAAAVLWTVNAALVLPLSWPSNYNQVLAAFFLLAAFSLFLSNRYWLQFAVFLLGFGALELNAVYPALLLAWLLLNRKSPRPALPLLAVSFVYSLAHAAAIRHYFPAPATPGPYTLHFDLSLFHTLYLYWTGVFVPATWYTLPGNPAWLGAAAAIVLSAAALFALLSPRARFPVPVRFFFLWFLITLAPVLPLRGHFSDYYLAIPALGLSAALCLAFSRQALLPASLAALYLWIQIPYTRTYSRIHFQRSREVRNLVLGVRRARQLHPTQAILLTGVSPTLFATALAHRPFDAFEIPQVFLAPGTDFHLPSYYGAAAEVTLPPGPTAHALAAHALEVYRSGPGLLKNITVSYENANFKKLYDSPPVRLDMGNPLMEYLLGSTWYAIEEGYRWMPQAAAIRIAGPQTPNQQLVITGYCPPEHTRLNPLKLLISIDGEKIFQAVFNKPESSFLRTVDVPARFVGRDSMELSLQADRTFHDGSDLRPRSLAIRTIELRQP